MHSQCAFSPVRIEISGKFAIVCIELNFGIDVKYTILQIKYKKSLCVVKILYIVKDKKYQFFAFSQKTVVSM